MANPRNYTQDADDTLSTVTPSDYGTGNGANARLRKINLNVDIATQAELNEAFNLLSNAIAGATGDLTAYYTKSEADAISTALSTAFKATDDAISAQLSTFALSTTVADAYKVTVEKDATAAEGYAASYTIKQGNTALTTKINIPKDYVVKDAALCTVTVANQPYAGAVVGDKYIDFTVNTAESDDAKHIYLPVKDLVDVYTGGSTTFADVNVDNNRVITVNVSADTISAAAVAAVVGTSEDLSTANTIYGTKKYVDAQVTGKNVDAEGDTYVTASASNNKVTVAATANLTAAVAAANSALQSISNGTDGDYVTTTVSDKGSGTTQTVAVSVTTADLTANTAGLAVNTDVKQYVDSKTAAQDITIDTGTTNGTISVTKGTAAAQDVAVKGLDTAAYEKKEAFDKAGDAAALQTAIKAAVNDTRFDSAAKDDYADIDAIIADLVKVRQALGALKALNVTLTPKETEDTAVGGSN